MNAIQTIPAEIVRPGIALQRVNVFTDGAFEHQVTYRGTIRQARAHALLQGMHDTDPAYQIALAALRGE